MSKFSLILAVLLLAAPAWARVDIECSQIGDSDDVLVRYRVTVDEPNKVRAFALDISVSGADIVDVNDLVSGHYYIYPGSIDINETTGDVDDLGTAVADPNYPGTLSGPNAMTVEMGALYSPTNDSSPDAPPAKGEWVDLLKFTVSGECSITITENEARGDVVLTNPDIDPDVNAPGCNVIHAECLIGGNADGAVPGSEHAAWVAWGKPDCWCYQRQCRGDINGQKLGPYWVQLADLNLLKSAWLLNDAQLAMVPNGICADINHAKLGPYRVQLADLNTLKTYWLQQEANVPICDQAPIITGPYNFWTN